MADLAGYFLTAVLPAIFAVVAIIVPFRTHRRTEQDRFLVLGVINAVVCGLALIGLMTSVAFRGIPGFLVYVAIAIAFVAMLILQATKKRGGPKARETGWLKTGL